MKTISKNGNNLIIKMTSKMKTSKRIKMTSGFVKGCSMMKLAWNFPKKSPSSQGFVPSSGGTRCNFEKGQAKVEIIIPNPVKF